MLDALRYFVIAADCYALFFFFGFPVARVLRGTHRDIFGTTAVITGICLVTGAAWTWTFFTDLGVRPLLYGLALANVVPFGLAVRSASPSLRRLGSHIAATAALAVGALGVFWHYNTDVVGRRVLVASMGNADLPVYALLAHHLADAGFHDTGFIAGANLGFYTETDYFGAFAIPTVPAVLGFVEPVRSLMPLMFLAMFLTVASLASLLGRIGGLGRVASSVLALLACSSSVYFYSVGQGFFAQLFAMAVFVKLMETTFATVYAEGRGEVIRLGLQTTIYVMGLICIYPHMAFLSLPILVGVAGVAVLLLRGPLRSLFRLVAVTALSLGTASLLLEARADIAVHKTFAADSTAAGWILPRVQVSQILGFQLYPNAPGAASRVADHAAALATISWRTVAAALLAAAVVLLLIHLMMGRLPEAQRRLAAWAVGLFAIPLASYYAFYGYFGASYQQWKWLSFFQPVLVVGGTTFVAVLLTAPAYRDGSRRLAALGAWITAVAILTLSVQPTPHSTRLKASVSKLRDEAALRHARGVNISVSTKDTFWDTMWAAYFVADKSALLQTPSYFPTHAPDSRFPTVRQDPGQPEIVLPAQSPAR